MLTGGHVTGGYGHARPVPCNSFTDRQRCAHWCAWQMRMAARLGHAQAMMPSKLDADRQLCSLVCMADAFGNTRPMQLESRPRPGLQSANQPQVATASTFAVTCMQARAEGSQAEGSQSEALLSLACRQVLLAGGAVRGVAETCTQAM